MDQFEAFRRQVRSHLAAILVADHGFMILAAWYTYVVRHFSVMETVTLSVALATVLTIGFTVLSTTYLTRPLQALWQAILHISPRTADKPAPDLSRVRLGREVVTNMVSHIYQLASVVDTVEATNQSPHDPGYAFVATNLPLPLLVLNKDENIVYANHGFLEYIGAENEEVIGKSLYSVLDMSFTSSFTLDKWLSDAKARKAVAVQTWERVRLNLPRTQEHAAEPPQCDMAAYYNQANPHGLETMLVFFDHTHKYAQDDQSLGFVALAVHELRTPVTLLRGYIEALQEELSGQLTPELEDFMRKMAVSAQQLSTFTNTILNVSRIENDELVMKLHKESWDDILRGAIADLRLRAEVRGIKLELTIDKNLPAVGVDRVSIYEVISNLVDNAVKYSNGSERIVIKAYLTHEGSVETVIQDFGVGIPENAMRHIFDKFYRNQRSRSRIGGTGLGLYLSKLVVEAHGGHIWVRSKPGEGSTFGFTLLPYNQVVDAKRGSSSGTIVRSAHGWIKNHSLYRR